GEEENADGALPLSADRSLFTARVSPRSKVKPGAQINLGVDVTQLHFFDSQSGLAIGSSDSCSIRPVRWAPPPPPAPGPAAAPAAGPGAFPPSTQAPNLSLERHCGDFG